MTTFSETVKNELANLTLRDVSAARDELSAMLYFSGYSRRSAKSKHSLSVTNLFVSRRILALMRKIGLDTEPLQAEKMDNGRYALRFMPEYKSTLIDLCAVFMQPDLLDQITSLSDRRRPALRGAFLACGSLSNPQKAYQLSFSLKKDIDASVLFLLMHAENIEPKAVLRLPSQMVYLKQAEKIADVLAFMGAHRALLAFENARIGKELQNKVNRVVNCDSGNTRRQADASARQIDLLSDFLQSREAAHLSEDLKDVALLRLRYPGYSLKELGELMQPRLGKSGVHHRLDKLVKTAKAARFLEDSTL